MSQQPMAGVGVFIVRDGRVLLLLRKGAHGAGSWSPPGGHLEFGESPEACAAREACEEVGIQIADLKFVGITNDIFEADGVHYITIWMEARYVSGEVRVNAPGEVTGGLVRVGSVAHAAFSDAGEMARRPALLTATTTLKIGNSFSLGGQPCYAT